MNYFVLCFILKWLNYSNWLPNIKNEPLKSSSVCGLWKHLRDDLFPFIGLTYYRALIMKQLKKMFRSVTTQALRPEALNHCTHGLLLQKPWFDVYNFPLLSSLPQPTGIHVRTFSAPSVLTSDAPQHQSLCSARWQHLGNLSSLPPFLPLHHLSLSPASFFDHSCLTGMREWNGSAEEGKQRRKNGDCTETRAREREQGHYWSPAMQATADQTKKESSWSSWKGQGTDTFHVICSGFVLFLHAGFMHVSFSCVEKRSSQLHVHINYRIVYLDHPFVMWTRPFWRSSLIYRNKH